jgi:adenylate cyclase
LPDTPARAQHELTLQIALGASLLITRGYGAADVEHAYNRARVLCQQVGDVAQLSRVLFALWVVYTNRAEHTTARELGEELLDLAQGLSHPTSLLVAHHALGTTLFLQGKLPLARNHLDHALALEADQPTAPGAAATAPVARVTNHVYAAWTLWLLGYPEQAVQRTQQALTLAHDLADLFSQVIALIYAAMLHLFRREAPAAQERVEAGLALATEHGFLHWMAAGTMVLGGALAAQGQTVAGIDRMRQGLVAWRAVGAITTLSMTLAMLAEVYGNADQMEEAQPLLHEAQALVDHQGERYWEAELHRLQGELLLKQTVSYASQAETCFLQALDVARRQQARSLELRAAMSLSRLWQHQGKCHAARQVLAESYGWFTEGFDTLDLQEARALLKVLT